MIKYPYILFVALWLGVITPTSAQDSLGTVIVFTSVPDSCQDEGRDCDFPSDLVLIDPITHEQSRIMIGPHDPSGVTISDDGSRLTYGLFNGVYNVHLPDGGPRRITQDASLDYAWPAISPDGRTVAYLAAELQTVAGQTFSTYDYRIHVASLEDTDTETSIVPGIVAWGPPVWSPRGDAFLLIAEPAPPATPGSMSAKSIYHVDVESMQATPLVDDGRFNYGLQWSTNGDQIVFTSVGLAGEANADEARLMMMNADGSDLRLLIEVRGSAAVVAPLSQDDQFLIYHQTGVSRPGRDNNATLNLLNLETGESRLLASSASIGGADWSPDGTQIVYSPRHDLTADICIITLEDGSEECLGVLAHWLAEPLWREVEE